MEQLYPTNIVERQYPILRERREKEEREAVDEKLRRSADDPALGEAEDSLYENAPLSGGMVGTFLNTLA